jgi:hypothetical protein
VLEVSRARRLLSEARALMAASPVGNYQEKMAAAASRASDATRLLGSTTGRAGLLLAAEALEISGSIDCDRDDLELGIGALVGAASILQRIAPDLDSRRALARINRTLGRAYSCFGMRDRAAMFAMEYLRALPEQDRDMQAIAYAVCTLAVAGQTKRLEEFVAERRPAQYAEPEKSILTILDQRTGNREYSAEALRRAARGLADAPIDLRVQCSLFAANALVQQGEPMLAAEILGLLRADPRLDSVTEARVLQATALAAGSGGDSERAQQLYLLTWTRYDNLRYGVGSLRIRQAIAADATRSRHGALSIAAGRQDWRQLLELIESCRLQAMIDIPGSSADFDETLATGNVPRRRPPASRVIEYDNLSEPYQIAVEDILDSRAEVAGRVDIHVDGVSSLAQARQADGDLIAYRRLDVEAVLRRVSAPNDLWWSTWYELDTLFWVLSRGDLPFSGGSVDLVEDDDLCAALTVASLGYRVEPPWPIPEQVTDVDIARYLAVADSFDELQLTGTLARLLPPELWSPDTFSGRLLISSAPELAVVPWAVLPLDLTTSPVTRLIERFELCFLPSLAVLNLATRRTPADHPKSGSELPFLLACNYFPTTDGPSPLPTRQAQAVFTAREQCDVLPGAEQATTTNVSRRLRSLIPSTRGVAFFRTHYEWVESDPGASGLMLSDGVLPCGIFGARDMTTWRTVLGLPDTVVLSCCSTSGNRERNGGETLGMAAMAIVAGARRLIATAVEIRNTAFTVALDDMLIDIATHPDDHVAALRDLQLRLLDEWRRYSLRDVEQLRDTTPTPDIWAHYQALRG